MVFKVTVSCVTETFSPHCSLSLTGNLLMSSCLTDGFVMWPSPCPFSKKFRSGNKHYQMTIHQAPALVLLSKRFWWGPQHGGWIFWDKQVPVLSEYFLSPPFSQERIQNDESKYQSVVVYYWQTIHSQEWLEPKQKLYTRRPGPGVGERKKPQQGKNGDNKKPTPGRSSVLKIR